MPCERAIADDVVDRQEVRLVAQVGNQGEFVLDDRFDFLRHAVRVARLRLLVGRAPQPGGRRLARRHDLLRILVAQFVEREGAALGDRLRLQQQLGGIDARQPVQRPQVTLGVRRQLAPALRQRCLHAHGGQHVVQALAAPRVHLRVAGGHQRQVGRIAHHLQRVQLRRVVDAARQLAGDPARAGMQFCQPARFPLDARGIERLAPVALRQQQYQHVVEPRGVSFEVGRAQSVTALGGLPPCQRHELAQVAVAGACLCEQHELRAGRRFFFLRPR